MVKWVIWGIYGLIAVGVGLNVFMVPPFQKPDEILHFERSATGVEKIFYGKDNVIKYRLLDFIKKARASEIAFKYDKKISYKEFYYKDNNKDIVPSSEGSYSLWVGYFPSALGIFLGSFSAYPVWTFWGGRLVGAFLFLGSVVCSLFLLRKTNFKYLILSYAILPMVWQQVTSIGHDVLQLTLAPVILALLILIFSKKNSWKYLIVYYACIIVFLVSKSGYQVMSLLFLFPLLKLFEKFVKEFWLAVILPVLLVIFIFRIGLFNLFVSFLPGVMLGQKEIFINDPWYVFGVVQKTISYNREFYLQGLLGYFGWLDYSFNLYQYLLIIMGILSLFNLSLKRSKLIISKSCLFLLGLIILLTFWSIIFAFYFGWTGAGKELVEGVQGRYFLVLVPFLLFFINQLALLIGKKRFYLLFVFIVLMTITSDWYKSIYSRYYDMNNIYDNADELVNKKNGEYNLPLSWEKIDGKLSFNMPAFKNKYIVGIKMDVKTENNNRPYPYKIVINNSNCSKEIKSIYTNFDLIKDDYYFHKIDPIKMTDDVSCIEISEVVKSKNNSLLINKGINDYIFSLIYRKE